MRTSEPKEGQRCMWGDIQCVEKLANGIWTVSTASHGGIKLDRKHNAKVPTYLRQAGGWYEEDCEWAIPFVLFRYELQRYYPKYDYDEAIQCFRSWFPNQYEMWSGEIIPPGVSRTKDEYTFFKDHQNDWIVISAIGQGNDEVAVTATRGGSRHPDTKRMETVVPKNVYDKRGRFGMVLGKEYLVPNFSA